MNTVIESSAPASRPAPAPERRPLLPGWARVVLTPILFIAVLVVSQTATSAVPGLSELSHQQTWPGVAAHAALCLVVVALAVGVIALMMRFVDRRPLHRAGLVWTRHSLPALLVGLGAAVAIVWVTLLSGWGLGQVAKVAVPAEAITASAVGMAVVSRLFMAFPLQGMPEEFFFRGYLMQAIGRHPLRACWISAAVFASIHLISLGGQQNLLDHVLYLAIPFGFGLLAAVLTLRFRSVWAGVGVHAGFHVAGIPAQLVGLGAEGRYFWLVTGALFVALAVALMRGVRDDEVVLDR